MQPRSALASPQIIAGVGYDRFLSSVHLSMNRILVAIPAYNEEGTIKNVVDRVRASMPEFDLLVINDGSSDGTRDAIELLKVPVATHLCNLGYGRAIQTAIKYALDLDYDAVVTLDADGQHEPEQVKGMVEEFLRSRWDVLIGSRHLNSKRYSNAPLDRRIGMQLFSALVWLVVGQRVYDTTSGLKVIGRAVFEPLAHWHFVDFHAEAIVFLMRLGYRIGEDPITVSRRQSGRSMYSAASYFKYPFKTSLMVLLGVIEAGLTKRKRQL